MTSWEYRRSNAPDLTALGDAGWELVASQNGEFIFKRPAQTASERFTMEQTVRALRASAPSPAPAAPKNEHGGEHGTIPAILNPELAALVRRVCHTQMLLVCDRGFPAPFGLPWGTLDLSLTSDLPTVIQVLDVILHELPHDRIILAEEMRAKSPERFAWHQRGKSPLEPHTHALFKRLAKEAVACIRTGDATPYASVILVGG